MPHPKLLFFLFITYTDKYFLKLIVEKRILFLYNIVSTVILYKKMIKVYSNNP
ncbi:hypothetical protein Pelsub_P1663 [Pelolinea submarina]|nr:hypothetical protein Pelsub_P1663 [Pelolinea submarina]